SNVAFKVKLNKTYHSEIYDNIFLFTIHVYDESLKTEGGEGSLLGTNNGKSYWMTVDNALFHYDRYDEMFPDATEGDRRMITTMTEQVKDIRKSFKMIGEKEDTSEEMEPKEQGAKGQEAEEVPNHETANGIKYTNEKLGFELTLPKFWKDYYIVEENDRGGITFKFKFDGKVYEDIYLFDIFVENREYSTEEQEMMGDVGILGIGNGKTYLITENLAMYYFNNYDEYFASVSKDGRNVIKAMNKQKKILNFKVLDTDEEEKTKENYTERAKTAEEGETYENTPQETKDGIIEEEERGEKYEFIEGLQLSTERPKNYDYYLQTTKYLFDTVSLRVIKTPIDNILTEVIKKPVSETNYIGINGGYYVPSAPERKDYKKVKPCSMTYFNPGGSTIGYNYNGCPGKERSLPTFVTYYDKNLKKTKAEIISAKSIDDINNHFKNLDKNNHSHHSNQVIINAIGGKGFDLEHYGFYSVTWDDFSDLESFSKKLGRNFQSKMQYMSPQPTRRTVLGFQEEEGKTYAYLMITLEGVSIEGLKSRLKKLGFDETNCIILDSSGSSSMRVYDKDNEKWEVDIGTEPFSSAPDANRFSYNMIRVIN
ncbi:hypothetical protein, partial [Priestia megaterium]|uniref:hypothetical protein n=1 Tax=Priestia megaterium TaxID=1404 RepID=UPI002FFF165E